ncbi:CD226 antigen-like [Oreochromis niloticus]|uniref:CD226 antigen-like n=1 Tax=Oreochromis niloticus TaxID=8128 RepID=UPI000DF34926|nr:CD226 antigen-like [Oreochromis niloticus]
MAHATVFVCVCLLLSAASGQKKITAEDGQDVTLTCRAPNNNNIIAVKWSRADLGDKYVFLYKDKHFVLDNQHPSFKNRVDLQDRQMKAGDVSLILSNVTINDTGTYECRVIQTGTHGLKLISIIHLRVDPPDQNITAQTGETVTLPCQVPNNNFRVIEWRRPDLKPEIVLMYRDGEFVPDNQHPSYKNRVDLQDRQMKDGDVSLILKDVTIGDDGTYTCCVFMEETRSWKLINTITLTIDPPGQPREVTGDGRDKSESDGLIVALSVSAVLLVAAVVGFLIYRKRKQQQSRDSC